MEISVSGSSQEASGSFQFEEVEFVPTLFKDPELKVLA
jgi:hypothetical protein